MLARSAPGSDHQLTLARAFAAAAQDAAGADLLAAWLVARRCRTA
jgi:hypothetical protein